MNCHNRYHRRDVATEVYRRGDRLEKRPGWSQLDTRDILLRADEVME